MEPVALCTPTAAQTHPSHFPPSFSSVSSGCHTLRNVGTLLRSRPGRLGSRPDPWSGTFGVTAYTEARRTSEIGLRMALGANRVSIAGLVLRGAFLQVAIGLLIGVPIAIGAGRLMSANLFQVRSWDPSVLAIAILLLGVSAAAASLLPASRAASTDPVKALRTD